MLSHVLGLVRLILSVAGNITFAFIPDNSSLAILIMDREQLKTELKQHIIKYLNLLEKTPADIIDDQPLFGDGLGLDSIDSIELVVLLEREYGIKINDPKDGRKIFTSIDTMADYVIANRTK